MGWNVLLTVDANTGKGSAQVHKPVPATVESPAADLKDQLGTGLWIYAADEDDEIFVDPLDSLPTNRNA